MPISNDLRTYAETALAQGRQVADSLTARATTSFGEVAGTASALVTTLAANARQNATGLADRASTTFADLSDRAEEVLSEVAADPRVARALSTAERFSAPFVDTVQQRVVSPVLLATRRGTSATEATVASAPAPTAPADTRPASGDVATSPAPKATTRRPAAKKAAPTAE